MVVSIKDFYREHCESYSEGEVLLKTDFEQIKIEINDSDYCDLRYLKIDNVVRFFNPKIQLENLTVPIVTDEDLPKDLDFDEVFEMLEESPEKYLNIAISEESMKIFFLPSHIEKRIKTITCSGQTRNIDSRLKNVLPKEFIEKNKLEFKQKGNTTDIVEYNSRRDYSLSLFKFFNEDNNSECNFDETHQKVNYVKQRLNLYYIESYEKYFIGDIHVSLGLIERDEQEHNKEPLFYHYNFWKLSSSDLMYIISNFKLYPFEKEVS